MSKLSSRKFWICVALEFVVIFVILCKIYTNQYDMANEYAALQWIAVLYFGGNVGEQAVTRLSGKKDA